MHPVRWTSMYGQPGLIALQFALLLFNHFDGLSFLRLCVVLQKSKTQRLPH